MSFSPSGQVGSRAIPPPATATAIVRNTGTWKVCVTASNTEARCAATNPDYWKKCEEVVLKCNETRTFSALYNWQGHAAEWWNGVLFKDGKVWDTTACVRNPYN